MVIYKYELEINDINPITMPLGAEILTVQPQHNIICLWVKCNPTAPQVTRKIAIHGTGNTCEEDNGIYIGTAFLDYFVWHVFDLGEVS